jgi:hypothetical protein
VGRARWLRPRAPSCLSHAKTLSPPPPPQGLDIRMDFASGKKYARNIPEADRSKYRKFGGKGEAAVAPAAPSAPDASASTFSSLLQAAGDDLAAPSSAGKTLEETPISPAVAGLGLDAASARIADVLLSLPEPEPELESALVSGMPRDQLQALLARVWERRQKVLKEAFASARTEAQQMQELLGRILDPGAHGLSEDDVVETLESLEFFVATVHNAEDFEAMGGLLATTLLLNSSHLPTAAHAAWVVGTAVKGHARLQEAAVATGAAPALVEMLHAAVDVAGSADTTTTTAAAAVVPALKAANKAVYALSGLMRFSPRAQAAVAAVGGHTALTRALAAAAGRAGSAGAVEGNSAAVRQARTLASKVLTLLADQASDESEGASRGGAGVGDSDGEGREDGEPSTTSNLFRIKLNEAPSARPDRNGTAEEGASVVPGQGARGSSGEAEAPAMTRVDVEQSTGARRAVHVAWTAGEAASADKRSRGPAFPLLHALRTTAGAAEVLCAAAARAARGIAGGEEGSSDAEAAALVRDGAKAVQDALGCRGGGGGAAAVA